MKKKNVLSDRWKSETPEFWIIVKRIGISIASSGTVIIGVAQVPGVNLPESFSSIGAILVAVGSVMAGQAQLTKK